MHSNDNGILMKLRFVALVLLFTTVLPLSAPATQAGERVVVSIKPLHSLVAGVMGKTGTPALLIEENASPHEYHMKPSRMKWLTDADIVFYIDDRFETFLPAALEALTTPPQRAVVGQEAKITRFSLRRGGAWEAHQHAHEHEHEHEHSHATDESYDPHIWLDPVNAQNIVSYIAERLSEIYPENKEIYATNAAGLITRLAALDDALKAKLSGAKGKPFIVFHDAYQYFERRYSLNSVGSIVLEPDESPSPHRIQEIRDKLQHAQVGCVFREPYFSDRLVNTVMEGSKAKSGTLDPAATTIPSGEELYFQMMENLAENLLQCLEG